MAQAGVRGLQFRLDQFVTIEVHESNLAMREMIPEARLMEEQFRVAVMTGAFSDDYGSGSQPQKRFGRAADQLSVSIHGSAEDVLHQVGLEQDGSTPNVQIERPDPGINQLFKAVGVLVSRKNRNARA